MLGLGPRRPLGIRREVRRGRGIGRVERTRPTRLRFRSERAYAGRESDGRGETEPRVLRPMASEVRQSSPGSKSVKGEPGKSSNICETRLTKETGRMDVAGRQRPSFEVYPEYGRLGLWQTNRSQGDRRGPRIRLPS